MIFLPGKEYDVLHDILDIWPVDEHSQQGHPCMVPCKNCVDMAAA